MPTSNLRELLQLIEVDTPSPATYNLFRAIVKQLEALMKAQKCRDVYTIHRSFLKFGTSTCGECGFFHEHSGCRSVDDREWASRFCYTDPESPACWNFVAPVECDQDHPCGESKEQYMRRCFTKTLSELRKEQKQSTQELAEAKAEIENLRKEYDAAKDNHEAYEEKAHNRIYTLRKERDQAESQIKELEDHILRMMHKEAK